MSDPGSGAVVENFEALWGDTAGLRMADVRRNFELMGDDGTAAAHVSLFVPDCAFAENAQTFGDFAPTPEGRHFRDLMLLMCALFYRRVVPPQQVGRKECTCFLLARVDEHVLPSGAAVPGGWLFHLIERPVIPPPGAEADDEDEDDEGAEGGRGRRRAPKRENFAAMLSRDWIERFMSRASTMKQFDELRVGVVQSRGQHPWADMSYFNQDRFRVLMRSVLRDDACVAADAKEPTLDVLNSTTAVRTYTAYAMRSLKMPQGAVVAACDLAVDVNGAAPGAEPDAPANGPPILPRLFVPAPCVEGARGGSRIALPAALLPGPAFDDDDPRGDALDDLDEDARCRVWRFLRDGVVPERFFGTRFPNTRLDPHAVNLALCSYARRANITIEAARDRARRIGLALQPLAKLRVRQCDQA